MKKYIIGLLVIFSASAVYISMEYKNKNKTDLLNMNIEALTQGETAPPEYNCSDGRYRCLTVHEAGVTYYFYRY